MRKTEEVVSWVVYLKAVLNNPGVNAVCEQGEWDAMELANPGHHTLIKTGITNEGEAERLARGPEVKPVLKGRRLRLPLAAPEAPGQPPPVRLEGGAALIRHDGG